MAEFSHDINSEFANKGQDPGPVSGDEFLIRHWHHPEGVTVDGKILPTAIQRRDLRENGLSINREKLFDKLYVDEVIKTQKRNLPDERTKAFFSKVKCQQIRELKDTNKNRACIVKDEPVENNPAHCGIYSLKKSKAELKKDRAMLIKLFEESLDEWKNLTLAS